MWNVEFHRARSQESWFSCMMWIFLGLQNFCSHVFHEKNNSLTWTIEMKNAIQNLESNLEIRLDCLVHVVTQWRVGLSFYATLWWTGHLFRVQPCLPTVTPDIVPSKRPQPWSRTSGYRRRTDGRTDDTGITSQSKTPELNSAEKFLVIILMDN